MRAPRLLHAGASAANSRACGGPLEGWRRAGGRKASATQRREWRARANLWRKITRKAGRLDRHTCHIIGFDSLQKAKDWNDSAGQKEVNDIRKKSTKSRSFVVVAEGM